jgi:hypothetical protein
LRTAFGFICIYLDASGNAELNNPEEAMHDPHQQNAGITFNDPRQASVWKRNNLQT